MSPINRRKVLKYTGAFASAPLISSSTVHGQKQPPEDTPGRGPPEDTPDRESPPKGEGLYHNPIFEPVFADPAVIRDQNGMYYAYATQDNWRDGQGTHHIAMIRSSNLVDWEYIGDVFEEEPSWIETARLLWAPNINYYNDKYYLYYSLVTGGWQDVPDFQWQRGIGLATAENPEGPFEDQGEVIRSREIGVKDSIDPHFMYVDGTPYMVWGSYIAGIYIIQLSEDGTEPVGEKTPIAGAIPGSDGPVYEGAFIIERDGYFYMFASTGGCCTGPTSGYHVEVGRSESLMGPYVNKQGENLLDQPGTLVLDGNDAFIGPGQNSITTDDSGQDWMVYHAYEHPNYYIEGKTLRRALMTDPLKWEDGWPTIEGKEPSSTQRRPVINQKNKPKLELSDLATSPNPVEANERLTVSLTAANSRGVGTVDMGLYLNGDLVETKPVVFDVGETRPVEFTTRLYRPPEDGNRGRGPPEDGGEEQGNDDYEVAIGPSVGQALPEQSVEFIPKPAEFEYTDLQVGSTTVHTTESIESSVQVKNIGSYEATKPVELTVDGSVVATKDVTLAPGASTEVSFTQTFQDAGTYDVTIGDLDPQSVLVLESIARIQAENAELNNVKVNTGQGGYTGSAYVTFFNHSTAELSMDWTVVDVPSAGKYTLYFRQAHGDSGSIPGEDPPHTLSIYINGEEAKHQEFPNTGGWGTWEMLGVTLQLTEGQNTISIKREVDDPGVSGINIDHLDLSTYIPNPPVISE